MVNKTFEENTNELKNIMDEMFINTITKFSIPMRLRALSNMSIGKIDSEIDWGLVKKLLTTNTDQFSYNNFEIPSTISDLNKASINAVASEMDIGAYQKHTCKDCNDVFYLGYEEVQFFKNKEWSIPKRCKDCRSGKTKADNNSIKNVTPVTKPSKTAIEIAFEKAREVK